MRTAVAVVVVVLASSCSGAEQTTTSTGGPVDPTAVTPRSLSSPSAPPSDLPSVPSPAVPSANEEAAGKLPAASGWTSVRGRQFDRSWVGPLDAQGRLAGQVRWEVALPAAPQGPPLLAADGTTYVTTIDDTLEVVSMDGQHLRSSELPGRLLPFASRDSRLVLTGSGVTAAID